MAAEIVAEIRELAEFPGYGVDRDGNVWSRFSLAFGKPLMPTWQRKLRQKTRRDGYREVNLAGGGSQTVHTLMLLAFIGLRPSGSVGCHCNGNKIDNRPENLRWDTQAENLADAERHGTRCRGETHGRGKLSSAEAIEVRRLYLAGMRKSEIGKQFGIHPNHVWRIASGVRWKHLTHAIA